MKLIKNENDELSTSVKEALAHYASSTEINLSEAEINNAWIKFSNTLEFNEKVNSKKLTATKVWIPNYRKLFPVFSGFSTAAVILYFIVQSSNQKIETTEVVAQKNVTFPNVTLANSTKEYELPKPEKFSELVKFVKEERQREVAESIAVKVNNNEFDNDSYSRRLSAELEQSLRDSFSGDSIRWNELEPMETTLSSNLMRADIVDSHNIVYVSR